MTECEKHICAVEVAGAIFTTKSFVGQRQGLHIQLRGDKASLPLINNTYNCVVVFKFHGLKVGLEQLAFKP